jgi:antitoxin component YwqK of YwqJK toxin-antitoxin module
MVARGGSGAASARFTALGLLVSATISVSPATPRGVRVAVERYASGAPMSERSYVGTVLDGPSRGWYENGARQFEYSYSSGASEGVQEQWYPSGQVYTLFHHHAGHELGQQQMWNADGTIRSNYVINHGRRFGLVGSMGCTGKGKSTGAIE